MGELRFALGSNDANTLTGTADSMMRRLDSLRGINELINVTLWEFCGTPSSQSHGVILRCLSSSPSVSGHLRTNDFQEMIGIFRCSSASSPRILGVTGIFIPENATLINNHVSRDKMHLSASSSASRGSTDLRVPI